jgi:hypothetical protein
MPTRKGCAHCLEPTSLCERHLARDVCARRDRMRFAFRLSALWGCFRRSLRGSCTLAAMAASGRGAALSRHRCFHRTSLWILAVRHRFSLGRRSAKLPHCTPVRINPTAEATSSITLLAFILTALVSAGFPRGEGTPKNRTPGAARCTTSTSSRAAPCR